MKKVKSAEAPAVKPALLDRIIPPRTLTLPNGHTVQKPVSRTPFIAVLVIAVIWISAVVTGFDFRIIIDRGYQLGYILGRIFQPNWDYFGPDPDKTQKLLTALFDTIKMSIMGSVIGATLALPIAVLSSTNIHKNKFVIWFLRILLMVIRTLPTLIIAKFAALIFGLGTTGMFVGDVIRRAHPNARIVLVARSAADSPKVRFALEQTGGIYVQNTYSDPKELARALCEALGGRATMFIGTSGGSAEHAVAFEHGVLGCNGIYNSFSLGPRVSFDTMPFGFENHLIFGSINFRQDHMETAIHMLAQSRYDEIVALIDKEHFIADPIRAYEEEIYAKGAPMKTAVLWNERYVDRTR